MAPKLLSSVIGFEDVNKTYVDRYMLILTQTIRKQISCQIFTNTAAGFLRTTVTVLQMD